MADGTVVPVPPGTPAGAAPAPAIVPPGTVVPGTPPAGQPPADVVERNGQVQVLSTKAYSRIRQEARERGRKEAIGEFATELGFQSVDELRAALQNRSSGGGGGGGGQGNRHDRHNRGGRQPQPGQQARPGEGQPPTPPAPPDRGADRDEWRRYERAKQQFQKDLDSYRRGLAQAKNRSRELQRQLDAKDAEMQLRETAVMAGVRDIDYAIRLLTRSLEGKSEEELKSFDEKKFFEGLRTSHPYLFGETVVPATTGTSGAAPAPKPPGAQTAAAAAGEQFNAMEETEIESVSPDGKTRIIKKMKPDLNAWLRKRGLNPIGV